MLTSQKVVAAAFEYDLGIRPEDLTILPAPSQLVSGQRARIYATAHNFGSHDTVGVISFYQGPTLIGESQPISVRATGFADEVFIDFIVPSGSFNILAKIRDTSPADQNPANDEAVTTLITPLADRDGDSRPDEQDNCPDVANRDQANNDGDSMGDACDPDDDNDGLSDIDELARGTNTKNPDTDGDGVGDARDTRPLSPDISPLARASGSSGGSASSGGSSVAAGRGSSSSISGAAPSIAPARVAEIKPKPQSALNIAKSVGKDKSAAAQPQGAAVNTRNLPAGDKPASENAEAQDGAQSRSVPVVMQQNQPRVPRGTLPKLWTAAGLSALFAGIFSFLALRKKTQRE
ncbi:MAG: hypothetical protein UX17_C0062G0003 [Parcubacteria group bacterium GW2011_GWC2_45_7]|nr:MAG: hypothetical protein UX17_C0062G0003 [Parcubacteria group bacterium GW2011_GWC2_45_7]KKU73979.1 MAG: hypothetical protein UX98_C0002G0009 [Parcubacteria group bacterium GW2011_GWA2_47_26]